MFGENGNFRVDGKVAIITGGAGAQGEVEARLLAANGAKVIITDVNDADGQRIAAEIGDAARFVHHDVGDERDWAKVIETALSAFGRIDTLVNNAGILHYASIEEETLAAFERLMRINVTGVFLGMRAVAAPMRRAGGGSIINISSAAGLRGVPHELAYCGSKWAVRGMTKVAMLEFGADRIRVNSVHPGPIASPMIAGLGVAPGEGNFPISPLGRIGTPDEIAHLILYLASDLSAYMTGAELSFDGGIANAVPTPLKRIAPPCA